MTNGDFQSTSGVCRSTDGEIQVFFGVCRVNFADFRVSDGDFGLTNGDFRVEIGEFGGQKRRVSGNYAADYWLIGWSGVADGLSITSLKRNKSASDQRTAGKSLEGPKSQVRFVIIAEIRVSL